MSKPIPEGCHTVTPHIIVNDVGKAVAAGAKADMPGEDTFWGDRYGKVTDPFGHHWSIATHTRDLSPEEMQKAMLEAFAQKKE